MIKTCKRVPQNYHLERKQNHPETYQSQDLECAVLHHVLSRHFAQRFDAVDHEFLIDGVELLIAAHKLHLHSEQTETHKVYSL